MTIDMASSYKQPESLDETIASLMKIIRSFNGKDINTVPFKGSWTAAQVADHITKSNLSIAKALALEGKPVDRRPNERASELKDTFLDFSTKMQAPGFILPDQDIYQKDTLINTLELSVNRIKEAISKTNLAESIAHPAFGEITKLELLYFVEYHTQRHIHQLKNIYSIANQKQYGFLSFLFQSSFLFMM